MKKATAPDAAAPHPSAELALLRAELQRMARRIATLEEAVARGHPAHAAPRPATAPAVVRPPPPPPPEPLPEELVLVLSAAIAAFLGKRPVIRQIRLLGQESWAHAGRVSIQGSHALHASRSTP